jgi:hypothetical protein
MQRTPTGQVKCRPRRIKKTRKAETMGPQSTGRVRFSATRLKAFVSAGAAARTSGLQTTERAPKERTFRMRPPEDEMPAAHRSRTQEIAQPVGARDGLSLGLERQFCFDWAPSPLSSRRAPALGAEVPEGVVYPETRDALDREPVMKARTRTRPPGRAPLRRRGDRLSHAAEAASQILLNAGDPSLRTRNVDGAMKRAT